MGTAKLIDVWKPVSVLGNKNIAGLSYSSKFIFTSYDLGNSNHVLIYPVTANGLCGNLLEQYEVDVENAQGMAVRKQDQEVWEFFFSSSRREAVFAYTFRFESGFALHSQCAQSAMHAPHSDSFVESPRWAAFLIILFALLART